MASLFFPIFNFIHNNKYAQIILGVGVVFALIKGRDALRDRHTKARVLRRVEKQSREAVDKVRAENDEKLAQADAARAAVPSGVDHSDGVPDELAGILFGG